MATRRKLINLINSNSREMSDNNKFTLDVQSAIERCDKLDSWKPSIWYKPSSLKCIRNMYFTRVGADVDPDSGVYNAIGMANTGTVRHESIQSVLLHMKELGYDWEYIDVEQYVKDKQAAGKCLTLKVKGTCGAETHLFDDYLKISFRCDGIIKRISTNEYYLFEFKNQTSFKYARKEHIDVEHIPQVVCYCTALDLNKAFVLYENRDVCEITCPEVFEVTDKMKQEICIDKIMCCEDFVEQKIVPPKCTETKTCRWCPYKIVCQAAGD